jgi:hypothetical protein
MSADERKDTRAGDPRFHAVLKEMGDTHDRKQQDYGTDGDPFANIRASREFGVSPWVGAYIRLNDKITRIKSFIKKGNLANESLEDSLIDIATYAAIALVLYREGTEDAGGVRIVLDNLGDGPWPSDGALTNREPRPGDAVADALDCE